SRPRCAAPWRRRWPATPGPAADRPAPPYGQAVRHAAAGWPTLPRTRPPPRTRAWGRASPAPLPSAGGRLARPPVAATEARLAVRGRRGAPDRTVVPRGPAAAGRRTSGWDPGGSRSADSGASRTLAASDQRHGPTPTPADDRRSAAGSCPRARSY